MRTVDFTQNLLGMQSELHRFAMKLTADKEENELFTPYYVVDHIIKYLPKDKIIWDVGHQSYTHKLLTGRREGFENLRKFHGMSGFPKRKESDCDAFDTGHSSTSISAGLGYVRARELKGEDFRC